MFPKLFMAVTSTFLCRLKRHPSLWCLANFLARKVLSLLEAMGFWGRLEVQLEGQEVLWAQDLRSEQLRLKLQK